MKIRNALVSDAEAISDLIISAVSPYKESDFTEDGWVLFCALNSIVKTRGILQQSDSFTLCYENDDKVVGIITMHQLEKLDQLYISPDYQGMGVARTLWDRAREMCLLRGNSRGHFWVKSSSYAVPIYENFGFKLSKAKQTIDGIAFTLLTLE